MSSSPPGMETFTFLTVKPFFTHAAATAQELLPEASVYPAPLSHMRIETLSGDSTFTNWTFILLGKSSWFSRRGPSLRAKPSSSSSTNTTQWGFPTETAVILAISPLTLISSSTTSRSSPATGTSLLLKMACPISTVTKGTLPSSETSSSAVTMPPMVSILNVFLCVWPCS